MQTPEIENEFQYRAARARIAALDSHLAAIADLARLAAAHRAALRIEDEDLRDLAPLADAEADIRYSRRVLRAAAAEWAERAQYGTPRPELGPVISGELG